MFIFNVLLLLLTRSNYKNFVCKCYIYFGVSNLLSGIFLRISGIYDIFVFLRCKELDLLDRCLKIDSRYATDEEILSKHSEKHLQNLRRTANSEDAYLLEQISSHFDSIYINSVSIFVLFCSSK